MPRRAKSTWLKGCEVCNAGLINEIDRLVEEGNISVNKASQLVADEGERKLGERLYSSKQLMDRYRYHKGLDKTVSEIQKPTTSQTPTNKGEERIAGAKKSTATKKQQQPQGEVEPVVMDKGGEYATKVIRESAKANRQGDSDLEKAAKHISKTADLLEEIISGSITDNGSKYDMLAAETIKQCGIRIIHNFSRIGVNPEKVARYYQGEANHEQDIRLTDLGTEEID
jgi:hypothetical protein